eukprot:CAMPEP_0114544792 /NCGR_PEP_ID=MMETSP0114-20121206/3062_1 /TAXON_ID=31324 /ORGANISM="Goniomonas sp, Strain m" /LENGTH=156 /DNA_ID=CAMNT_0001729189 /DNA_START=514 /DNA_END=984 /DNA_ORIENTATION=+
MVKNHWLRRECESQVPQVFDVRVEEPRFENEPELGQHSEALAERRSPRRVRFLAPLLGRVNLITCIPCKALPNSDKVFACSRTVSSQGLPYSDSPVPKIDMGNDGQLLTSRTTMPSDLTNSPRFPNWSHVIAIFEISAIILPAALDENTGTDTVAR